MRFILDVPYYDGYECAWGEPYFIEAEDFDAAIEKAKKFKEFLLDPNFRNRRPVLNGKMQLYHLEDWLGQVKLKEDYTKIIGAGVKNEDQF